MKNNVPKNFSGKKYLLYLLLILITAFIVGYFLEGDKFLKISSLTEPFSAIKLLIFVIIFIVMITVIILIKFVFSRLKGKKD